MSPSMLMSIANRIIIIADADRNLRSVLRMHLGERGFHTILAADGREAETIAAAVPARLVILDVDLAVIGIHDACVRIRMSPGYRDVPIVLLTSVDSPQRRAASDRAGASAMLVKPFSVNDLMRIIDPLLLPHAPADMRSAGTARTPTEAPVQIWTPRAGMEWRRGQTPASSEGVQLLELIRTPVRPPPARTRLR